MKSVTFQIIGDEKIQDLIDRLDQSNEHYILTETNHSVKIKLPERKITYMCTPDYMSFKNWGTLASIKSHLNKSGLIDTLPVINRREIQYFKFRNQMYFGKNSKPGEIRRFSNVAEFDISAAYINSAKNLGILTDENFQKLEKGPKLNRLKILGALATVKNEYYIHKGEIINEDIIFDKRLRNVWFNIVMNVDRVISEAFEYLGPAALFYYVDNIYFDYSIDREKYLISHFEKFGFQIKPVPLEKFFLFNSKNGPVCVVKRQGQSDIKTFFIPKQKQITYEISN